MRTVSRRAPGAWATAISVTVLIGSVITTPMAEAAEDLVTAGAAVTSDVVQDDPSPVDDGTAPDEPDRGRSRLLVIIAVVIGGVGGGALGLRVLRSRGGVPVDGEDDESQRTS